MGAVLFFIAVGQKTLTGISGRGKNPLVLPQLFLGHSPEWPGFGYWLWNELFKVSTSPIHEWGCYLSFSVVFVFRMHWFCKPEQFIFGQNFLIISNFLLDAGVIPWHMDGSPSSNNTLCMYLYCHILSFSAPWSLSALLLFLPAGNRIFRGFSESSL